MARLVRIRLAGSFCTTYSYNIRVSFHNNHVIVLIAICIYKYIHIHIVYGYSLSRCDDRAKLLRVTTNSFYYVSLIILRFACCCMLSCGIILYVNSRKTLTGGVWVCSCSNGRTCVRTRYSFNTNHS